MHSVIITDISIKGLLQERDTEENVRQSAAAITFCLKIRL
jgi:hypothetical protein